MRCLILLYWLYIYNSCNAPVRVLLCDVVQDCGGMEMKALWVEHHAATKQAPRRGSFGSTLCWSPFCCRPQFLYWPWTRYFVPPFQETARCMGLLNVYSVWVEACIYSPYMYWLNECVVLFLEVLVCVHLHEKQCVCAFSCHYKNYKQPREKQCCMDVPLWCCHTWKSVYHI